MTHLKGLASALPNPGLAGAGPVHTVREKQKLVNRVKRIRGQVAAVEELLEGDADCERAVHTLAACRGAISATMSSTRRPPVTRTSARPPSNSSISFGAT
jgi:hypothetical protein